MWYNAIMAKTTLFFYGTLKTNQSRNHILNDQSFIGSARTKPVYNLYNQGAFPVMVPDPQGKSIEGELWEVDDNCLKILDMIEGHPNLFKRTEVELETGVAQAYLFQLSIKSYVECGECWNDCD
jgi:gamma-glutamylcyclotransferase (GGCT)/AIG2-like uncharacterized protein YtfP